MPFHSHTAGFLGLFPLSHTQPLIQFSEPKRKSHPARLDGKYLKPHYPEENAAQTPSSTRIYFLAKSGPKSSNFIEIQPVEPSLKI